MPVIGTGISNQSCANAAHGPIVHTNCEHASSSPSTWSGSGSGLEVGLLGLGLLRLGLGLGLGSGLECLAIYVDRGHPPAALGL